MRALATLLELTTLPGCTVLGSTVPENLSTSTFWFTPICFSPVTTMWPLASTSTTVAVMVPAKVLALSVPPLPEKSLVEAAPTFRLAMSMAEISGAADIPASMLVVRLEVDFETWLAVTFSTI